MPGVSFQPTEADLIAAYRLHFFDSLGRRRAWTRIVIGAGLFALLSALFLQRDFSVILAGIIGAIYWFGLLAIILGLNLLLLPKRFRRIFAQQKSLHGEAHVEWTSEGISFRNVRGHTDLRWSDFVRLVEGRHTILLMQSDALFNFIPKLALSPEESADIMARG